MGSSLLNGYKVRDNFCWNCVNCIKLRKSTLTKDKGFTVSQFTNVVLPYRNGWRLDSELLALTQHHLITRIILMYYITVLICFQFWLKGYIAPIAEQYNWELSWPHSHTSTRTNQIFDTTHWWSSSKHVLCLDVHYLYVLFYKLSYDMLT